tara:strand:+ start:628 stop:798 length:171 start_codon:yes stop_codon:yes gene_type:complete
MSDIEKLKVNIGLFKDMAIQLYESADDAGDFEDKINDIYSDIFEGTKKTEEWGESK